MTKSAKPIEVWFRAGSVERGSKYKRRDGYAELTREGLIRYPWLTKREAQSAARSRGAQAKFFDDKDSAAHSQHGSNSCSGPK